jgi:hypothetical protein
MEDMKTINVIIITGLLLGFALSPVSALLTTEKQLEYSDVPEISNPDLFSGFFIIVYGGRYTDRHLGEKVLMLKPIYYEDSWTKTLAVGRILMERSEFYRLEFETQFTKHIGEQSHYEFNLVFAIRMRYNPFSTYMPLSLALGNGISYATEVPVIEERSRTNINATKLLNYLMLEIAAEIPKTENWELIGRIHHRSGVFGLYNGVRGGSNIMTAGLRYYF